MSGMCEDEEEQVGWGWEQTPEQLQGARRRYEAILEGARAEERARIVAWLRKEHEREPYENTPGGLADRIEEGEHLS